MNGENKEPQKFICCFFEKCDFHKCPHIYPHEKQNGDNCSFINCGLMGEKVKCIPINNDGTVCYDKLKICPICGSMFEDKIKIKISEEE